MSLSLQKVFSMEASIDLPVPWCFEYRKIAKDGFSDSFCKHQES